MKKNINILEMLQNIMGAKLAYLVEPSKSYWSHTGTFSITNLSRWVLRMSKRGLERFYAQPHDWLGNCGVLVAAFLGRFVGTVKNFNQHWLLTVDETVEKKAGHATHGVGYHYSSKAEKVVSSIAVLNLSLTHRFTKLSLPLIQEQLVFPTLKTEKQLAKKAAKKAQQAAKKAAEKVEKVEKVEKAKKVSKQAAKKAEVLPSSAKPMGRPKGSKNKPKTDKAVKTDNTDKVEEIAYTFQVLSTLLDRFLTHLAPLFAHLIGIKYVVGDGGFGNNTVAVLVRAKGLELISKLQYNAALYFPFEGTYSGKGRPKIYGDKINYECLEEQLKTFLVEKRKQKDGSIDYIFHVKKMIHKSFDMPLNVVFILRFDKNGQPKSHKSRAVLFSTDMEADYNTIMDAYQVRFQIEFNFRDARQFFGLSNFKNIKKQQVQNVIGYAFFMVTLSNILIFEIKQKHPQCPLSIQDLKAFFRAEKYIHELLNRDEFSASLLINRKAFDNMPIIGAIHAI